VSAEGFAAVPNWVVRDEQVSIYAISTYVALASHSGPGGIHPGQATLAREARCSERKVRDALVELEALGVVERVRRKDVRGRATNGYVLLPNGRLGADEERIEVAAHGAGTGEVKAHGAGGYGTREQSAPYIEEEPVKEEPPIVPREVFEEFWSVYPRRVAKSAALAKFMQLARQGVDLSVVVAGARRFAADPNLPDKQFVPHPLTWLNQGRWEDEPLPARGGRGVSPTDRFLATVALGAESPKAVGS
jgi:hypothetical protein